MNGEGFKETEMGLIPEKWEINPLDFYLDLITYGFTNPMPNSNEGPYLITAKNVNQGKILYSECRKTTQKAFDELLTDKSRPLLNDILLTKDGTLGRIGLVDQENCCINQSVALLRPNSKIIPKFLKYLLESPYYQQRMDLDARGTTIRHIQITVVNRMNIAVPPLVEQKAITDFLSAIYDKIELNQRMNQTLEEIGRAIFKHWFVDFEFPDEEGRPYKSSGGEMVDSELGEIPKGWEVGTLGQIVDNFDSRRIPLSGRERESKKGNYPYYGATSIMDYVDDYIFNGIYILMAEDGSVIDEEDKPILQYVWGKFWVNNHTHVLKGKKGIPEEYIYFLLKNSNVKALITGAVQLKINQKNMNSLKVIIPDLKVLKQFSNFIDPLFTKYRNSVDENENLSQVRDSLFPKLMSGKIRTLR